MFSDEIVTDERNTSDLLTDYEVSTCNAIMDRVIATLKSRFIRHRSLYVDMACLDPSTFKELSSNIIISTEVNADDVKIELISFARNFESLKENLLEMGNRNMNCQIEVLEGKKDTFCDGSCRSCPNCALEILASYKLNDMAYDNLYELYKILCYIMLYYIILYYIILYYIMLYYIMLYYIILYYIMLYYIILYYIILYYVILYYIILYYVILCYVMLCYVMLCYVMLCYVMLCYVMLCYVMLCYVMLCYVMLCYVMLCYVMLCYVMLCYVMLCYVMLCYVMLCYVMLCYVMLCYVMLCYVMLCYVMLCYVMLYYVMLCYVMLCYLYYIILYYIILYYIILYYIIFSVTTVACERTFSKLKIIKTRLLNSMSSDHLESYMIMAIEKTLKNDLDIEDILGRYASTSSEVSRLLKY